MIDCLHKIDEALGIANTIMIFDAQKNAMAASVVAVASPGKPR